MVEATIRFKGGYVKTLLLKDFNSLIEYLKPSEDIVHLDARVIPFQETRQGRY